MCTRFSSTPASRRIFFTVPMRVRARVLPFRYLQLSMGQPNTSTPGAPLSRHFRTRPVSTFPEQGTRTNSTVSRIEVSLAAAALGATVIEKHFTLDRTLPGPDHRASLEPAELKEMVQGIRNIEASLGDGWKTPSASEFENRERVRKGLVATKDFKVGHRLRPEDLMAKRPGNGISPGQRELVIGAILQKDIERDSPITWEHLLNR